jgi:hypothetical protein
MTDQSSALGNTAATAMAVRENPEMAQYIARDVISQLFTSR